MIRCVKCKDEISYKKRQFHDIRTGFYWHEDGEETVVPLVTKTLIS
jgi:hypothetical protein